MSKKKYKIMIYRSDFSPYPNSVLKKVDKWGFTENITQKHGREYIGYSDDEAFTRKAGRFFLLHGCKCLVYEDGYTRGANVRHQFFLDHPMLEGRYQCAYCGKKFDDEYIEVDHIVPVYAVEHPLLRKKYIKRLNRHGITNINDDRNLTYACRDCNQAKFTKRGIWVLRGRIGKLRYFWPTVHVLTKIIPIIIIIFIVYFLLSGNGFGGAGDAFDAFLLEMIR